MVLAAGLLLSLPDAADAKRRSSFSIFIGKDQRLKIINITTKLPPGDTFLSDGPVSVTLITPTSYQLAKLSQNDYYYLDRGFILTGVPGQIDGRIWIKAKDDDKLNTSAFFLQFEISDTARVYVLYDANAASLPTWLTSRFTLQGFTVSTSNPATPVFNVYRAIISKGTVRLGGNAGAATGAQCNYIVVVRRPVNGDLGSSEQLATTEMLLPRSGHRVMGLSTGKVLVVGGVDTANAPVMRCELYDSATQSFVASGTLNEGRINPAVVKLNDGRVLIIGGEDISRSPISTCEIFDPVTQFSTLTGNLTLGRRLPEAIKLSDGRVFVSGGVDTDSVGDVRTNMYGDGMSTTELFDPSTGLWTAGPNMLSVGPYNDVEPGKRYGHRMALLPDGRVLIAGGMWHGPELGDHGMTGCDIYDPVSNTMTAAAPMTTPRARFGLVDIGGKIMVMGGLWYQENDPLNPNNTPLFASTADAEIYDPLTNVWTRVASLPRGMYDFALTSPDLNRALLFDGYDVSGTEAGEILLYDGNFNTWTLVGNLVTSRSFPYSNGAAMVADVGGKDYFLCGGTHFDEATGQTSYLYTGERFKY